MIRLVAGRRPTFPPRTCVRDRASFLTHVLYNDDVAGLAAMVLGGLIVPEAALAIGLLEADRHPDHCHICRLDHDQQPPTA